MKSTPIFEPSFKLDSPYLSEYFSLWNIHGESFESLVNHVQGVNLSLHMQSPSVANMVSERDSRLYEMDSRGIAMFQVAGPTMKAVPSMSEGTSTIRLRQQINAARRDPEVKGGLLMMDTPGGTSRGNEDFAKDVARFAKEKPIVSFTEDMTCSAGVSVASHATRRYANNATAMYGAMGTYAVVQDTSGIAEKLGVKVHVIKAGKHKGDTVAGSEITEEQLNELQRIVDTLNENYLGLIANGLGRSVDSIREMADGRAIFASDAVSLGLINGVQTAEQTLIELHEMVSRNTSTSVSFNRSNPNMADKTPATLQELKSTFPNSTAEWRETQLEAGNDISQAAIGYASHVEAKAAAAAKEAEEKHAKELEAAKSTRPSIKTGHDPLTVGNVSDGIGLDTGDAVQDFHEAVRSRCPRGRQATYAERQNAIAFVARTRPDLHRAYIAVGNPSSRAKRVLEEKYEDNAS